MGAIALLVSGCATGTAVAPPEVTSMLAFSAYPGATLIDEQIGDPGPQTPWTSGYGMRIYETGDAPAKVKTHYEKLAMTHGWTVEGPSPPPSAMPDAPAFIQLRRQRFTLSVDVRKGDGSVDHDPEASPDPNARTRISVSAHVTP